MRSINKKLGKLGALALLLTQLNCYTMRNSVYDFDGKVDEEKIKFSKGGYFMVEDENILTVTKTNGITIRYIDEKECDLKIESVEIINSEGTNKYTLDDVVGKIIVQEGQRQFDKYLKEIKEKKIADGLGKLR